MNVFQSVLDNEKQFKDPDTQIFENAYKNKQNKENTEKLKKEVHTPNHYQGSNGIETKDVIAGFTSDINDGYVAYCTGNIIKYACRWHRKNGVKDLLKAKEYINYILAYLEPDLLDN